MTIVNVDKLKRLLLITIGVMAAMIVYYIWAYNLKKPEVKPEPISDVTDADVVVNDFEVVEMVGDRVLWILRAKFAEVYSDEKETRLQDVEVDFFDEAGKSVHLVSDQGIKDDDTGNIIATGNVRATDLQKGIVLRTEELMYNASTKRITSDSHVVIERGTMVTQGEGLDSDVHLKEAKILRDVVTSFTPAQSGNQQATEELRGNEQ